MIWIVITNRYMRITGNGCRQTETTTKDIFCNSTIDNSYSRIIFVTYRCSIFSLVTTTIYITFFTIYLSAEVHSTAIDYDSNRILRSTIEIVTTEDVVDNSVGRATLFHRHGNRTIDVSSDSFRYWIN